MRKIPVRPKEVKSQLNEGAGPFQDMLVLVQKHLPRFAKEIGKLLG